MVMNTRRRAMKIFRMGILAVGLLMMMNSALFQGDTSRYAPVSIQITDFYEDYNFISSFSTNDERLALLNHRENAPVPGVPNSERLERVMTRMKKLRDKIRNHDPAMVKGMDKCVNYLGFPFRPVLFHIGKSRVSGNFVILEIHSYELEPEMILRFISDYDQNQSDDKRILSLEERIQIAQSKAPGIEVHRWSLQDGNWMKSGEDIFYLEEKN